MLLVLVRPGEIINVTNLGFRWCSPPLSFGGQRVLLNKFSSSLLANAVFRECECDDEKELFQRWHQKRPRHLMLNLLSSKNVTGNTSDESIRFKTRSRRIARSKRRNAHHKIVQNGSVCSPSSALGAFFSECSL